MTPLRLTVVKSAPPQQALIMVSTVEARAGSQRMLHRRLPLLLRLMLSSATALRFLVAGLAVGLLPAKAATAFERQPERPIWERTLTPQLVLLGENLSEEQVKMQLDGSAAWDGPRHDQRFARQERLKDHGPLGQTDWWGLRLTIAPEEAATPLVIEIDESRVVEQVWINGTKLPGFDRDLLGDRWGGGEGTLLLPVGQEGGPVTVLFSTRNLTQLYPNAFGQLRLRPATLSEAVQVDRSKDGQVEIANLSRHPISGRVEIRHEDFFGASLGQRTQEFTVEPGTRIPVNLSLPGSRPDFYKSRVWAESEGRRTFEFWEYAQGLRTQWQRPLALMLKDGWEFAPAAGPHANNPPPGKGWHSVTLPHSFASGDFNTDYYYYRRTLSIPAGWTGDRFRLFVPQACFKAQFYLDGKPFAERYNWQLPGYVDLPSGLKPGGNYELVVALTDYKVGLAPGFKALSGARAQAAPLGENAGNAGLNGIPELIALPAIHADSAVLRTTEPAGAPQISGSLAFVNDTAETAQLQLKAAVFAQGEEQFTVLDQSITMEPGRSPVVEFAKPFPNPRLWRPEDPHLYELRVTLANAAGEIVDTFRERFGFRSFDTDADGDFTLNGDKCFFLGGSHRLPLQSLWPFLPETYRWVRGCVNLPTLGLGYGVRTFQACDEMGVMTKGEDALHNALHSDRYAYQLPQTWDRIQSQMLAFQRALGNSPGLVMWDVGNELKYDAPGEPERMAKLFADLHAADPTRIVTDSGGKPGANPSMISDVHGTPSWDQRTDYFFYHPEERPSYWREAGVFHRPARGEDPGMWTRVTERIQPTGWLYNPSIDRPSGLLHQAAKPTFYSEGHYVENIEISVPYGLVGFGCYFPIPTPGITSGFAYDMAYWMLTRTAVRRQSIATARTSGMSSTMLHVDRGVGRWALPLAVFSLERRARFADGAPFQDTFLVHNNTSQAATISTRWALYSGENLVGEFKDESAVLAGGKKRVEVKIPVPAAGRDTDYRLEIRSFDPKSSGYFGDDLVVTSFSPSAPAANTSLTVFDPAGTLRAFLDEQRTPYENVADPGQWDPAGRLLILGEDALAKFGPEALSRLREGIASGGRVIVLQQKELPAFLRTRLTQSKLAGATAVPKDVNSPLTLGLANEDFRYWQTEENDWITYWYPLEIPSTGNFRAHVVTERLAPLLEVREGGGAVLFCQLNVMGALQKEPAAQRLLANLLAWQPAATVRGTLVVDREPNLTSALRNRLGMAATYASTLEADTIAAADLIVTGGTADCVKALSPFDQELSARLNAGGRLFVQGLDAEGAAWLSRLSGSPVELESFAMDRAWPTVSSPFTAFLDAGDFYWGEMRNRDITKPLQPMPTHTGHVVVGGPRVRPLLNPAFLAEIPVGRGTIVVSTLRGFDYPVPKAVRALNTILTNLGARLAPESVVDDGQKEVWNTRPVDLSAHVNWSLSDDERGRRGWTMSGSDNDLRGFPTGSVTLRGVNYLVADPAKNSGNSLVALSRDQQAAGFLPERKGVVVDRKAERLYFLHASAWGTPSFVYRVYYKEDREAYIFGKADPFIDVVVKGGEHIADWWFGGQVDRGDRFVPGATVAWKGMTERSRKTYNNTEVGVYQMTWDNPHPEKTIESVDVLLPPDGGDGQIFLFGISTGDRVQKTGAAAATPKLEGLIPAPRRDQVYRQFERGSYGFVMLKDGSIPAVYGRSGKPAFRLNDWILQASRQVPGKPPEFRHYGGMRSLGATIADRTTPEGEQQVTLTAEGGDFSLREVITLRADRLHFRLEGIYAKPIEDGWKLSWVVPVSAIPPVEIQPGPAAPTPPRLFSDAGAFWTVDYPTLYAAWGATRAHVGEGGVTFYMPLTTGQEQTVEFELAAP